MVLYTYHHLTIKIEAGVLIIEYTNGRERVRDVLKVLWFTLGNIATPKIFLFKTGNLELQNVFEVPHGWIGPNRSALTITHVNEDAGVWACASQMVVSEK